MSLRGTRGTSLTEVMVMMVILGMAIVGIYSMVNSGRKLAILTDTRLTAINIAREGLESVATLRDTFGLKGYESGSCTTDYSAFFSIDEEVLTSVLPLNCPQISQNYILQDTKTLVMQNSTDVCINEFGWYSQEFSVKNAVLPAQSVACSTTTTLCGGNITQSCKTRFKREITFTKCTDPADLAYCVNVTSKVTWGAASADETLILSQIMTPLD